MTLLFPAAIALSAVGIPIIAMYVLKLRRQESTVSSTYLWQRAIDDVQANTPWQRLRPNILLFFQLLAVFILVFALAAPALSQARTVSGDVIVLIDQTYAMQGRDIAPNRLAAAMNKVHGYASNLGPGNVMSVIGMASQPHLIVAGSSDLSAIEQSTHAIRIRDAMPNFAAALSLAMSLARSGESTRAIVLTSRDSGITELPVHVPFPVSLIRLGADRHDLGISALHVSAGRGATAVYARVKNFGLSPASSDFQLLTDNQLADVRPVSLLPGRDRLLVWTDLPAGIHVVKAVLTAPDDLASDNIAFAVMPVAAPRRALLVTNGNYFLQTALTVDPTIQVSLLSPAAFTPGIASGFDLVIFDGFLPASIPSTATLFVAPPRGSIGSLRFGERVATAGPVNRSDNGYGQTAGLLQYVDFTDLHLGRTRLAVLPPWLTPLIRAGRLPLIAAGENSGRRIGLITFDLQDSDWPLRVSFPVVIRNFLHYLAPTLTFGRANITADQPLDLFPAPGTEHVEVTRPDGSQLALAPPFARFSDTGQPGIYTVVQKGRSSTQSAQFAVNRLHPNVRPVNGPGVLLLGSRQQVTSRRISEAASLSWLLALAALGLLTFEWWFAMRR